MSDLVHPLLPASTPLLSTSDGAVQVGGVDSSDGVLVGPDAGWIRALLRGLDGRRSQRTVVADAVSAGRDGAAVESLLAALRSAGLLVDLDPADLLAADAGPAAAPRTAAELPAAGRSVQGGVWRARRAAAVVVEGATRVGTPLAALSRPAGSAG